MGHDSRRNRQLSYSNDWIRIRYPQTIRPELGTDFRRLRTGAAMRGQSLEDFHKTRNAQVLYSVTGGDEGKTTWDGGRK